VSLFLEWSLRAWSVIGSILILGIVIDVLAGAIAPSSVSPLGRFFAHRDNLRAVEWTAAEQARGLMPACPAAVVDTDDRLFFYNLRYRAYPTWIVPVDAAPAMAPGQRDSLTCRVYYHGRVLRVEEARFR
jgi:hypothetical protein